MENNIKMSLLRHIEHIVELSEKSKLSEKFYEKAGEHIDAVCKVLNVNTIQTVFFSHLVDRSNDGNTSMSEIAEKIKIRTVRLIQYQDEIDELEKRRLVRCYRSGNSKSYYVPTEVLDALRKGEDVKSAERTNLSIEVFFDTLNQLLSQLCDKEMTQESFAEEINHLLNENEHLTFVKKVNNQFCTHDLHLLLRFCNIYVEDLDDSIYFGQLDDYFESRVFRGIKRELSNKANTLMAEGWVECVNDNGFESRETFKLTDKAKEELLGELNLQPPKVNLKKDILEHDKLVVKQMFYNPKEQKQVKQLTDLLSEDHFVNVQNRLKDKGMRTGFACLFWGAPGTGKTETVYQIARQTGRNIFMVDISETKSMWFGESEKRIKEVFEKYKSFVKSEKKTPILLFNEADAVIGKRKDVTTGSVAQTENAIQNIILQEMENLDGIMIATTNLTQNLDKAFERRFLYKIEFEKPNAEAKQHIWQSIIPTLQDNDAAELSRTFDFSGGQIENIARKSTVDSIILGEEPNLNTLVFHCNNEQLAGNRKPIGFNVKT
ncbi:MAG: AAA family ATPase [Bacteroidales bacterium]|nr:AAA family ATPase [Bacteroidales bacterium]